SSSPLIGIITNGRKTCLLPTVFGSLRIIAAFAASHGILAINIDADGAPGPVAHLVCRTVRQSIDGTEISDYAIISAGQIFQLFAFIESSPARVGHFLHPIMREIESLLLNVQRA